ncbi:hypothetical protein ACI2JR_02200 [Klebsiella sp. NPDC088457]
MFHFESNYERGKDAAIFGEYVQVFVVLTLPPTSSFTRRLSACGLSPRAYLVLSVTRFMLLPAAVSAQMALRENKR